MSDCLFQCFSSFSLQQKKLEINYSPAEASILHPFIFLTAAIGFSWSGKRERWLALDSCRCNYRCTAKSYTWLFKHFLHRVDVFVCLLVHIFPPIGFGLDGVTGDWKWEVVDSQIKGSGVKWFIFSLFFMFQKHYSPSAWMIWQEKDILSNQTSLMFVKNTVHQPAMRGVSHLLTVEK